MIVKLIIVEGAKRARFPIKLPTIIGRSRRAKLKLRASIVSRKHCEIFDKDGELFVRDLGSTNGTIVNGRLIQKPTRLTTDDMLTVGPVTLRIVCDPGEVAEVIQPAAGMERLTEGRDDELNSLVSSSVDECDGCGDSQADSVDEPIVTCDQTDAGSFVRITESEIRIDTGQEPLSSHGPVAIDTDERPEADKVDVEDSVLRQFLRDLE